MSPEMVESLNLTNHARSRAQALSIPAVIIEFLFTFGARKPAPGGVKKLFFDKSSIREMRRVLGGKRGTRAIERWFNTCAIVGPNSKIITLIRE
jgi:hypothetical protein